MTEKISPSFRFPPKASVIKPIRVGPTVQPTSPATANSPNIAIVAFGMIFVVRLIVAGHIADTASPQSPHPARDNTAFPEREARRYDATHTTPDKIR